MRFSWSSVCLLISIHIPSLFENTRSAIIANPPGTCIFSGSSRDGDFFTTWKALPRLNLLMYTSLPTGTQIGLSNFLPAKAHSIPHTPPTSPTSRGIGGGLLSPRVIEHVNPHPVGRTHHIVHTQHRAARQGEKRILRGRGVQVDHYGESNARSLRQSDMAMKFTIWIPTCCAFVTSIQKTRHSRLPTACATFRALKRSSSWTARFMFMVLFDSNIIQRCVSACRAVSR